MVEVLSNDGSIVIIITDMNEDEFMDELKEVDEDLFDEVVVGLNIEDEGLEEIEMKFDDWLVSEWSMLDC